MDPLAASTKGDAGGGGEGGGGGKGFQILFRFCFNLALSLTASFLCSFVLGLVALAIGRFSASAPVSVPSTCRILTSTVDLRSSKVCELGVLNYKAKNVFYPSERKKYRCRYDYYWASVFEVEYKEYFSGQIFHAIAEAPKEALPEDCRPDFGTAWLTRMMYKVNETYSCRYTPGSKKADIFSENLFNCQAKEPSPVEMFRRCFFLLRRFYSQKENSGRDMVYIAAGFFSGVLACVFFIVLIKSFCFFARTLARKWDAISPRIKFATALLKRAFILVAYFSAIGWLTMQYGKMIGLGHVSFDSSVSERTS